MSRFVFELLDLYPCVFLITMCVWCFTRRMSCMFFCRWVYFTASVLISRARSMLHVFARGVCRWVCILCCNPANFNVSYAFFLQINKFPMLSCSKVRHNHNVFLGKFNLSLFFFVAFLNFLSTIAMNLVYRRPNACRLQRQRRISVRVKLQVHRMLGICV